MRALLALYLIDTFGYSRGSAGSVVHAFIAACYLLSIPGGFIADRLLGRYRTIVYFAGPYIAGPLILGGIQSRPALFVALALLALGSGTIKPSTSPLMASIYEKAGKAHLLPEAFSYFYAAINLGSALTTFTLPALRNLFGYRVALAVPAAAMALALAVFVAGRRYYPLERVGRPAPKSPEQRRVEWETLSRLSGIFLLIACWWFVYDESASSWVFLARDHLSLRLWPFSFRVPPDQIQGFKPVLIVLLSPVLNWFWDRWKRRSGKAVPATRKMLLGFGLTWVCMALMSGLGSGALGPQASVWWEILAHLLLTLAELCISVVGLEMAYTMAPASAKATLTAAFLLTVFLGNLVGSFFDRLYDAVPPGFYFGLQTLLMTAVAIAFYFTARRFERRASSLPGAPL